MTIYPMYPRCGLLVLGDEGAARAASQRKTGGERPVAVQLKSFSPTTALIALAFAITAAPTSPSLADGTVKIGLIVPMTGGQASTGRQIDSAVKLYMEQNGDTVAGKKIVVILKDD